MGMFIALTQIVASKQRKRKRRKSSKGLTFPSVYIYIIQCCVNLVWCKFGVGKIWCGVNLVWGKLGAVQIWCGANFVLCKFGAV